MAMITMGTIAAITAYKQSHDGLGMLRFNTSSSHKRAQNRFDKGIKHLNLFAGQDAVAEFTKALEFDPDFVMAKVGTALAQISHLGYGTSNFDAGKKVLSAIHCNSTETCKISNHELGYLNAARSYFNLEAPEPQRLENYSLALKAIFTSFPKDATAGAMYAISLLSKNSTSPVKARDVLEKLYGSNPRHPGVLLGMVLAYDSPDPAVAKNALKANKKISTLVYKSSIALHAASHISQTMGNYSDVLVQNQKAYTNSISKCYSRFTPLSTRDHCDELIKYMSLEWIHNSLMMTCDYTKGLQILDDFDKIVQRSPKHAPFQGWLLRMYARQVFGSKGFVKRISHSDNVGQSWIPASIEGGETSTFWDAYSEAGALLARGQDILKSKNGISLDDSRALLIISSRLLTLTLQTTTPYIKKAITSMHLVHLASSKFYDCKSFTCAQESISLWIRAISIERTNKRDKNTPILPYETSLTLYSAFIIENLTYFRHSSDIEEELKPSTAVAADLLQESVLVWGPRTRTILLLQKVTNKDPIQKRRWRLRNPFMRKVNENNLNPQCLV